jgi:hypothetical protein
MVEEGRTKGEGRGEKYEGRGEHEKGERGEKDEEKRRRTADSW